MELQNLFINFDKHFNGEISKKLGDKKIHFQYYPLETLCNFIRRGNDIFITVNSLFFKEKEFKRKFKKDLKIFWKVYNHLLTHLIMSLWDDYYAYYLLNKTKHAFHGSLFKCILKKIFNEDYVHEEYCLLKKHVLTPPKIRAVTVGLQHYDPFHTLYLSGRILKVKGDGADVKTEKGVFFIPFTQMYRKN